jgi:carbamoyl-phosphate synthase large subunit
MVDTCAGEFPSATPYLYGSYDEESESAEERAQVRGDLSAADRIASGRAWSSTTAACAP